jgi:hypothetical protein
MNTLALSTIRTTDQQIHHIAPRDGHFVRSEAASAQSQPLSPRQQAVIAYAGFVPSLRTAAQAISQA